MNTRSFDDHTELLDSFQVAELLGHTPVQIRLLAQQGTIPAHRGPSGRQWLVYRDEVVEWIRQHAIEPEDRN